MIRKKTSCIIKCVKTFETGVSNANNPPPPLPPLLPSIRRNQAMAVCVTKKEKKTKKNRKQKDEKIQQSLACVADWGCPQRGSRHQRSYRRAGAVRVQWQALTRRRKTRPRRWPVPVVRQPSVRRVPPPLSRSKSATPIREAASASRPVVRHRRPPASRICATRRRPRWIPCGRPNGRSCCSCRARTPSRRTIIPIITITTTIITITTRTRRHRRAVYWNRRVPQSAARRPLSSPLTLTIPIILITTTTIPSPKTTITTTITAATPPPLAARDPWTTFSKG